MEEKKTGRASGQLDCPSRNQIIIEMALRIFAILFGSIALVVSASVFLGTQFFTTISDKSLPLGSVGYSLGIALLGTIIQVTIVLCRAFAYASNRTKFFFRVTIALSFFLVLAHTVAGILCSIIAAVATIPSDVSLLSPSLLQLLSSLISSAAFSFSGVVLYGILAAWEIYQLN